MNFTSAVFYVSSNKVLSRETPLTFDIYAPTADGIETNAEGTLIRFHTSGNFRFVFEGHIQSQNPDAENKILFDMNGVAEEYQCLLQPPIPSDGYISCSIIMTVDSKTSVKLHFHTADKTIVKSGSRLQIYRV